MTRGTKRQTLLGTAVVFVAFAVAAAIAIASQGPGERTPHELAQALQRGPTTPVRYGTGTDSFSVAARATPAQLLDSILRSYGGHAVLAARVAAPPPHWQPTEDPSVPVPPELANGQWAYFTVSAAAAGAPSVRGIWEANLVAGLLRDYIHATDHDGELMSGTIDLRLPNGEVVPNASGAIGNVAFAQKFSATSEAASTANLRRRVSDAGLTLRSLDILHPHGLAPALVVEVSDPAAFVKNSETILASLFAPVGAFEGFYFEADDANGAPVLAEAAAYRSGASQLWIRPDLDPRHATVTGG